MTREEAIKELKNIKESIFWGDEYGVCFRDEWVEAYEMAISALREQTKLATNLQPEANSCKWISVKDRLPESPGIFLVFTKAGNQSVQWFHMLDRKWPVETYEDTLRYFGDVSQHKKVTHWMPLPEPPKEDET